jgi:hypothetical protein
MEYNVRKFRPVRAFPGISDMDIMAHASQLGCKIAELALRTSAAQTGDEMKNYH